MHAYPVHTIQSAPDEARPSLEALQAAFGMIPNIAGVMANSPVLIACLVGLFGKVHGGSFTETQIQVILLTDAVVNASEWPVAFHSTLALQQGVAGADVEAIREGRPPGDPSLAALSSLARAMIETRGRLQPEAVTRFLDAGFEPEHLLEVIAIVAASTITNYTASIAHPPLEDVFQQQAWPRP